MSKPNTLAANTAVYSASLALMAFISLPLLWMVVSSLKPPTELFVSPPTVLPNSFTLDWYRAIFTATSAPNFFLNSFIVGALTTVVCLVIGVMAAYAVTRFEFPGKNVFLFAALVTYMFPAIVLFVPIYMTLAFLGLTDTYIGLVICHSILTFPFAVWMLRSFFVGIPREIDEAAWVDGSSYFATFTKIILPLSLPGIFSVGIFVFVQSWNEFLFASIIMSAAGMKTIPVGISEFITSFDIRWGEIMAMGTLATVPVVILFMFAQRYFLRGVLSGAVKG
jgi:ABC-type glycerol-3-phosphate transport system permease component